MIPEKVYDLPDKQKMVMYKNLCLMALYGIIWLLILITVREHEITFSICAIAAVLSTWHDLYCFLKLGDRLHEEAAKERLDEDA